MCQGERVNAPGAQTFNNQLCVMRGAVSWGDSRGKVSASYARGRNARRLGKRRTTPVGSRIVQESQLSEGLGTDALLIPMEGNGGVRKKRVEVPT